MEISDASPTPYPAVNAILAELLPGAQIVLGPRLTGFYLDGSLALGGFDADSDVDFIAVIASEVTDDEFLALQAMHDRLVRLDTPWAVQLEGSYISTTALRRYDPANATHPNLERGPAERLKRVHHDADWIIHRWVVRERGQALLGPPPATLIDPVTPDDLRGAALGVLRGWYAGFLDRREAVAWRGYQSYMVLSLCRILYTVEQGAVASKPVAAEWAKRALGEPWAALINRAWAGRHQPGEAADPGDVTATLDFIRLALAGARPGIRGSSAPRG